MGQAARGLMLMTLAKAELRETARACHAAAQAALVASPASRREAAYADALGHWLKGRPGQAAATLEAIVTLHPADALALKLAHAIRFMLGEQAEMLAFLDRAAPAFPKDHPLAGFVLGCHAFALEERGRFEEAERAGRMAVERAPRDVWGRHAVAHVMEMKGRTEEGLRWLADGRHWAHANNLRFHMSWHMALFRLERGETREALALYDADIRAEKTDDFRDIANGASLLARLEFDGIDVGGRWDELAEIAARRIRDGELAFAELHYTLALLGAGRWKDAGALASGLASDAMRAESAERRRAAGAGVSAAMGLMALKAGDHAEAATCFAAARRDLGSIGGSHAQRDLFELAHIEAALGAGDRDLAETLLRDRVARRGGQNRYAARRLARLGGTAEHRLAALALAATPVALVH
jgi:tetratricopeptide (TPR) repeat protein